MKKILIVLLAISLLAVCAFTVNAAETSGKCGDDLTWTLSDDGRTLTISGTGPMYDYSEENPAPWTTLKLLECIVIEDGVTYVGNYAFVLPETRGYPKVFISRSVTHIGDYAFHITRKETTGDYFSYYFLGDAPVFGKEALRSVNRIYVVGWNDEAKASLNVHPGKIKECTIDLDALKSRQLVGLNETLKLEDFAFGLYEPGHSFPVKEAHYIPRQFSVSAYDNSTYGEKNVTVTADGYTFDFTYYVTDGANHLDLINVEFPSLPTYASDYRDKVASPTITMGSMVLEKNDHYTLTFTGATFSNYGQVTVKGKNIAEGFEKTFYFPLLMTDLTGLTAHPKPAAFTGMPISEEFYVDGFGSWHSNAYQPIYDNNINVGTATVRAVGVGNYCGEAIGTFDISLTQKEVSLPARNIGNIDGELSDDIPYYEEVVGPGKVRLSTLAVSRSVVAINLYKFDGETFNLIKEQVSSDDHLDYDLTHVYEGSTDTGGEVYLVSYSWVEPYGKVYAGSKALFVSAKVPDATAMTMTQVEGDGDFRKEYFSVTGDDGALGQVTWETSDPSVAVVENGTVTFKKPGTVSVSAQWGELVESSVVSVTQQDLTAGIIFDYHEETGARVIWDGRLLEEGTDYLLTVDKKGDAVTVTATGCGLFTGELMKTFDGLDSLADPHTHSFDNVCDGTCNGCDFTRDNDHTFAQTWTKDQSHHWHACTGCGLRKDEAQHTLSPADDTLCTVCGSLHTPGDLDGNYTVNEDDAIYLLQHILLPDYFPITQYADYSGDNRLDEDDAIYLLQHVLLPDYFPLS